MAHHSVEEIERLVLNNEELKDKLFCRGYLITDNHTVDLSGYPFYGKWSLYKVFDLDIIVHPNQHFYCFSNDSFSVFLIGNALNPFDGVFTENDIVKNIGDTIFCDTYDAQSISLDYINQLTGSFFIGIVRKDAFLFLTDPTEMLFSVQGIINGNLYISSHTQLIGDLCNLSRNAYIDHLENYKFFYKYGVFFPGELTQYENVERVLTNHLYEYKKKKISYCRFYPNTVIEECKTKDEYNQLIEKVSDILKNTLKCAAKKWKKPAISLTGGMDSKTTLAVTNGFENEFYLYSYISMDGDIIDAKAAHTIAERIGVSHSIIEISDNVSNYHLFKEYQTIMEHNMGGYRLNENDIRKRIYFDDTDLFDVEIKSWVSEIARANYYKKFGLKKMPKPLSPRNMTAMYKVFLHDRKLAKDTDKVFEHFIEKTKFNELPEGFDPSDMYLWEFRYSSWGGMVITMEHSFSYEIFIPFNNRCLLNDMLKAPLKKRISDEFHEDLIRFNNKRISDTGITITNWNETKKRMYIEKFYFILTSKLNNL